MYYMRDANLQAQLEEERANNPAPNEETNLPTDDRMKTRLAELLHKKHGNIEDEHDLAELLLILENDDDPDDDIFKGHHGNYAIGDGHVGCNTFAKGTDDYATENLARALEHAAIAKGIFGDEKIYHHGSPDPEQQAVTAYASHLNGLNMGNGTDFSALPPNIQKQMEQQFEEMKRKRNPEPQPTPELAPEATSEATNDPQLQSAPGAPAPSMEGASAY